MLIAEGLRGGGAILVNSEGKRFFNEMSTRDKVSTAELNSRVNLRRGFRPDRLIEE